MEEKTFHPQNVSTIVIFKIKKVNGKLFSTIVNNWRYQKKFSARLYVVLKWFALQERLRLIAHAHYPQGDLSVAVLLLCINSFG
jgi:hypothetical protein